MSLKTEGKTCVRCHAYLFPEDDVVYCPVCGAPHHRDCYTVSDHCALEELHGTEQQYDAVTERTETEPTVENIGKNAEGLIICRMCHEKYEISNNSCPKCGAPNIAKAGGSFVNFDFLGGVPADFDIGDGVTADEAKRFVVANTYRYIPKFAILNKKNKVSWNWMAFLFPCEWMLSRKMYKNGIITGVLTVIANLLYLPFLKAINNIGFSGSENSMQLAETIYNNIPQIGIAVLILTIFGMILNLSIRVVAGVFGDYIYKGYTIASIKTMRAESNDIDGDYRKKGGASFFLFLISFMAIQYLPSIIAMFI